MSAHLVSYYVCCLVMTAGILESALKESLTEYVCLQNFITGLPLLQQPEVEQQLKGSPGMKMQAATSLLEHSSLT